MINNVSSSPGYQNEEDIGKPLTFKTIFKQRDPESAFILFIVPVILTLWVYYGKQANFDQFFKGFKDSLNNDIYSTIYEYSTAFLLMFWVPYFFVKMAFKKGVREFGFQMGDKRYGFRFVLIAVPLLIWSAYIGASGAGIQKVYPLAKSAVDHLHLFVIVEIFYLIYYVSWEFFFRGFMLFGLEKRYGSLTAILIQTIPSAIVHIGIPAKPATESFGAIFAGLIFGYLAIRTRSIFYPLLLHAVVGIATDIFVTLRV
jgi:membrane protease YdiL (CAAX protease family)